MKQLILGVLGLGAVACQSPGNTVASSTTDSAATLSSQPVTSTAPTKPATPPTALPRRAVAPLIDSLSATVLQQYDLSRILQTTHDDYPTAPVLPMNGFFGVERRRIELVFTRLTRDSLQIGCYHVEGKDRYRNRITPFSGRLYFLSVQRQPIYSPEEIPSYTAQGIFELREDSAHLGAGTFRGRVFADFTTDRDNQLLITHTDDTPTQQGGIKYEGEWAGPASPAKPVVWVDDILSYHGPQVFSNFVLGERDADFNPKYAKLGWSSYWENDEWWAEPAKPAISL